MMRRLIAGVIGLASLAIGSLAQAKPEFVDVLTAAYPAHAADLAARSCANCHVAMDNLAMNPFGAQLKQQLQLAGTQTLTADILHKVDALDADGDGVSNGAELNAGTNPGDPKSVPAKTAAPAPSPGASAAPPAQPHPAAAPQPHTAGHPAAAPPVAVMHSAAVHPGAAAPGHPGTTTKTAMRTAPGTTPGAAPGVTAAPAATAVAATTTSTNTTAPGGTTAAPAATAPAAATTPAETETNGAASTTGTTTNGAGTAVSSGTSTEAAPVATTAAAAPAATPTEESSFIPKTAWHPAIVHFPIALFIAGLFLDLLGLIRNNKTLLFAGWYDLILAAVSAVAGVISGGAAMLFMQFPVGAAARHMAMAVIASFLMWMMVSLRVHRHEQMNKPARVLYYVLAAICLVLLSWAGHLGGIMAGTG